MQQQISKRRQRQKNSYDHKTKSLQLLTEGQKVRIEPTNFSHDWKPGICIERLNTRSYLIETEEGRRIVRNRRMLASVPTTDDKKKSPATHRGPSTPMNTAAAGEKRNRPPKRRGSPIINTRILRLRTTETHNTPTTTTDDDNENTDRRSQIEKPKMTRSGRPVLVHSRFKA